MNKFYIFDISSGKYLREENGSSRWIVHDLKENEDFTFITPPDNIKIWRWLVDKWVELLPINNPDIPYSDVSIWDAALGEWVDSAELLAYKHVENQALMWERIKAYRQTKMTSGVYVPSVDKWFHTDETSATQYAFVGLQIARGNYTPLTWKTMSGAFVEFTVSLFNEVQDLMMQNTQTNYFRAEHHKYMMSQANDPLTYDYSTGWTATPPVTQGS